MPLCEDGKWPGKLLHHQDNALTHKPVVAMAVVHDCDFELVDQLPYFSGLVPSNHFWCPFMKYVCASGKTYIMLAATCYSFTPTT